MPTPQERLSDALKFDRIKADQVNVFGGVMDFSLADGDAEGVGQLDRP